MIFYVFNLSLIILFFFYSKFKKSVTGSEKTNVSSFFIFSSLFMMSGFRYMVGTDFLAYKGYFESINRYSFANPFYDKGYYLLNRFISFFTDNSQYVFLATSFIIIYLVNKTLKDYSISYTLSIFLFVTLYFYNNSFNIVRQFIVVSLILYSIKYLVNKDFKGYLVLILIASLFHDTALLMIPFYWILRMRFNKIVYLVLLAFTLGVSFFTTTIIGIVSKVLPSLNIYSNYYFEGSSANSIMLSTSLVFLFALLNKAKLIKLDSNVIVYVNAVYFALLFSILARENILFYRFSLYFYIFILLLIPLCIRSMNKFLRVIMYMLIIPTMTAYYFYLLSNNNAGVLPYDYNLNISFYNDRTLPILLLVGAITLFLSILKNSRLFTIRTQKR